MAERQQIWSNEKISEFISDMEKRAAPSVDTSDLEVTEAVSPMPDVVKAYYDRVPGVTLKNRQCLLRCPRCLTTLRANWPARPKKAKINHVPYPKPSTICDVCVQVRKERLCKAIREKWADILITYNERVKEDSEKNPVGMSFLEHTFISHKIFNGCVDWEFHTWKGDCKGVTPLMQRNLVLLAMDDIGERFSFVKFEVFAPRTGDITKLLLDWAIKHVDAEGQRVCRNSYHAFTLSLKDREEILELLQSSSFYQISYAIYKAEEKAIAAAQMSKRPKDQTFKNTLRFFLENLLHAGWQVPAAAKVAISRSVPDDFWRITRSVVHDLCPDQVLSEPLENIHQTMIDFNPYQEESASLN